MNLGIEVTLPRGEKARFPDRCVVCRRPSPGHTTRLLTSTIGWGWGMFRRLGGFFAVRVPACRPCGWRLQAGRVMGLLLTIVLAGLVVVVLGPHLAELDRGMRRVVLLIAFCVALSPLLVWELVSPPPFTLTAWRDKIDYEFRDDAAAYEFAELNAVPWDEESLGPRP